MRDMLGIKLGTENEVRLRVGAMVGRVPDEPKMVERESDVLRLALDGEILDLGVPTLLEPVLRGTVTDAFVLGIGVGITETVDETVAVPGLPALVRIWVLVPEVTTKVAVVSSESRPEIVRVYGMSTTATP